MNRILFLLPLILLTLMSTVQAKGGPQIVSGWADGMTSGTIVSPWGGNLGGSWSNPYGSFASSNSGYGRYTNAAGFL
ncbi:unnamed protein product [Bursaphelenchus okinawaensis]|uniref:Uncharacterized protein n=1 Tax=Bursaphelenchus okinawaensis TaxID=465554 RepID=A0A811JQG8_9BILA|nr:unnamed protein product [Bursaphelenchus okinawaensis]CAG9078119.1 unnamed protein product [Bursaphelenchus okinawaensis]